MSQSELQPLSVPSARLSEPHVEALHVCLLDPFFVVACLLVKSRVENVMTSLYTDPTGSVWLNSQSAMSNPVTHVP